MHSLLAVTPEGLPLGVLGLKTWVRPPEEYGKTKQRKRRPIQDKESVKWLEGIGHLASLKAHCPDTQIVGVCDREGDVYIGGGRGSELGSKLPQRVIVI
jgi:hypothetical protein